MTIDCRALYCLSVTSQLFVSGYMVFIIHILLPEAYHTDVAARFERQVPA